MGSDELTTIAALRLLRENPKVQIPWTEASLSRLANHGLLGYFHRHWNPFPEEYSPEIHKYIAERALVGCVLLSECSEVEGQLAMNLIESPIRMKGASLVGQIYCSCDERELTDIDLLVHPQDWKAAGKILRDMGYQLAPQIVWSANQFKATFAKKLKCGIYSFIDLHSQILWRQPQNLEWETTRIGESEHLSPRWQLAQLVANFAFQDNFVTLKKLLDIDLWLKAFPKLVTDNKVNELFDQLKLKAAWYWTNIALTVLNEGRELSPRLLSGEFLEDPQSFPLRYVWLKQMTKDTWSSALSYSAERTWAYHIRPKLFGGIIGHDI